MAYLKEIDGASIVVSNYAAAGSYTIRITAIDHLEIKQKELLHYQFKPNMAVHGAKEDHLQVVHGTITTITITIILEAELLEVLMEVLMVA